MTIKELIRSFIDQALLFNTNDTETKKLGVYTWIALAGAAVSIIVNMAMK